MYLSIHTYIIYVGYTFYVWHSVIFWLHFFWDTLYSRIPASTQVACIAAWCILVCHTCTMHKYCIIVHVHMYVQTHVVVKSLITSTWVRHCAPLRWPLGKNTCTPPIVHNLIPSARVKERKVQSSEDWDILSDKCMNIQWDVGHFVVW